MEDSKMSETRLTSAAAFVEGGIQDPCDDSCSICLEAFCESDPASVTGCKHEFHLQCILEWCQRSSQCPMCLQPISLKDPSSQELLDAIEHERNIRMNPPRNTAIFHHPTLGDFELQHLPVNASDSELEERIIQHLAAAAAMGRARHLARREGQRSRSSTQGRPQFLVFSTHPNAPSGTPVSPNRRSGVGQAPPVMLAGPNSPYIRVGEDSTQLITPPSSAQADPDPSSALGSSVVSNSHGTSSSNRRSPNQSSAISQDHAGPSDLQSFSESLKSRLSAISLRYKESITKSTRGWRERLFSRNSSMPDSGPEVRRGVDTDGPGVRRGVDTDVATVSRMMERLEAAEERRTSSGSISSSLVDDFPPCQADQQIAAAGDNSSVSEHNVQAPSAASSASN